MQFKNLSALSLVFAIGLAACSDSTDPGDSFDPSASAAELEAVGSAFNTDAYASLSAMGGNFGVVAAAPALAASVVDAGWISVSSPDKWELYGGEIANALLSRSAAALLIPDTFRGRTYEHNAEGYFHNANRAGAPANGIRFILYEVNPITGEPGATEIGWVDVMDESTNLAAIVRLSVWSGEIEYINYTVGASGVINSVSFDIDGWATDGTTQVNFTLNHSIDATFATARAEIDYQIDVPSRDFSVAANMVVEFDAETQAGSITIEASFSQANNNVVVQGSIDSQSDSGTLEVLVNGNLFATITFAGESITVAGPNGNELSQEHAQALRKITDALGDIFEDTFEDLFSPVEWLFNIGGSL